MLPDLFGNIVILPNHHFMTTAYNSTQKRLSFYDSEGKFIETKGEYPEYGEILTPFEKIEGLPVMLPCLRIKMGSSFFINKQI